MRQGFVKVAAVTPKIVVADTKENTALICAEIKKAEKEGAKIIVLPELCITGYTCSDLFLQEKMLREARQSLLEIAAFTFALDCIVFVGLPFEYNGKLYNVAAAVSNGKVLGFVPKTYLPNYNEFYEARHFTRGMEETVQVSLGEEVVPMGKKLLFTCQTMPELKIGVELCEDLWTPEPPSIRHALNGANVIVNLSASDETTGKDIYREELVGGQSARLLCGYIYASAGDGESTQDVVYSAHNIIAENGRILKKAKRFANETVYSEIDVLRLNAERRRMTTFETRMDGYTEIPFALKIEETELTRYIDPMPFVPGSKTDRERRCDEILSIQAMGLKKRLEHTHCKSAVIGISGGLDSTLALLVCVKTFDKLGWSRQGIVGVTMPGFGTTDRTYTNAIDLMNSLGVTVREVSIKEACIQHFKDIDHDVHVHDVVYENAQARERTQILMDIANQTWGMVIGTGDLSELALGWATYNGDHMSMYGVNASVPKTLVKHLVKWVAEHDMDDASRATLLDIVDTPISPELIPADENGNIQQITEDLVGPYELHDFFLYYFLRCGFRPSKIFFLAARTFKGMYDEETIKKWLQTFCRRFFNQQFKRSCLPDGPKVGSISLSPRGDWRMPSDASSEMWLREVEGL